VKTSATLAGLVVLAAACAEAPVSPLAPSAEARAPDETVVNAAFPLFPVRGSGSRAFGAMLLVAGVGVPPNPCDPRAVPPEGPAVEVCAVIVKPWRETIEGGSVTFRDAARGADLVLPFRVTAPPNPCLVIWVVGTLALGTWTEPGPPTVAVSFRTSAGSVAGAASVAPGPPELQSNPGPPNVCTVTATAG
jgi:hypothetical protein